MNKLLVLLILSTAAHADPALEETRYVSKVVRNSDGSIHRRADVVAAFKRIHPCPSTGRTSGACPGWAVDHVLPLSNGYCDCVSNLQWMPNVLKSGKGYYPKDRWERKINSVPLELVIMPVSGTLKVE